MRKGFMKALIASSVTAAAAVAAGAGAVVPASASVAAGAVPGYTAMCHTVSGCFTPRLYGDSVTPLGQAMELSPTVNSLRSAQVLVAPNDATSILQDWIYVDYGTASSYQAYGGIVGLTAFDYRNYGPAHLFALEFAPAGLPTGFCLANVSNTAVLRTCNGSVFQTFINTATAVGGLTTPTVTGYLFDYYLSAVQVANTAHHYAATGSRLGGVQVTFTTPRYQANEWWGVVGLT